MARPRLNAVNFTYTLVGLAVAGGIGYYVWRTVRNRRLERGIEGEGLGAGRQENLMELRRSTRKAGRAIKDTGSQVGKDVRRGASDVGEAFEDANSSGQALVGEATGSTGGTTGYKGSTKY